MLSLLFEKKNLIKGGGFKVQTIDFNNDRGGVSFQPIFLLY